MAPEPAAMWITIIVVTMPTLGPLLPAPLAAAGMWAIPNAIVPCKPRTKRHHGASGKNAATRRKKRSGAVSVPADQAMRHIAGK